MKSLQASQIHAVKIDVEGAEGCALAGMTELMTKMRPRFLIEVHRTHAGVEERVLKILRDCHFESELLDRPDETMHVAARSNVKSAVIGNGSVYNRNLAL